MSPDLLAAALILGLAATVVALTWALRLALREPSYLEHPLRCGCRDCRVVREVRRHEERAQ